MRNKLPMNKFRLAVRRSFLIINTVMFWKQIFSRDNGAKRNQNGAAWSLIVVCQESGNTDLQQLN